MQHLERRAPCLLSSSGVKPSRGRASSPVWHPLPQALLSPWAGNASRKQKPSRGAMEGPKPHGLRGSRLLLGSLG